MTIEEVKEYLKAFVEAYEPHFSEGQEDFNPMSASGGNFDDCYWMGFEFGEKSGQHQFAYDLFQKINIKTV